MAFQHVSWMCLWCLDNPLPIHIFPKPPMVSIRCFCSGNKTISNFIHQEFWSKTSHTVWNIRQNCNMESEWSHVDHCYQQRWLELSQIHFHFLCIFAIQGEMKCRILISACGALHKPITPEIEGAEQFRGDVIQLGLWEIGQHSKRIGVQYQ